MVIVSFLQILMNVHREYQHVNKRVSILKVATDVNVTLVLYLVKTEKNAQKVTILRFFFNRSPEFFLYLTLYSIDTHFNASTTDSF